VGGTRSGSGRGNPVVALADRRELRHCRVVRSLHHRAVAGVPRENMVSVSERQGEMRRASARHARKGDRDRERERRHIHVSDYNPRLHRPPAPKHPGRHFPKMPEGGGRSTFQVFSRLPCNRRRAGRFPRDKISEFHTGFLGVSLIISPLRLHDSALVSLQSLVSRLV
jgi:hypothetical protein